MTPKVPKSLLKFAKLQQPFLLRAVLFTLAVSLASLLVEGSGLADFINVHVNNRVSFWVRNLLGKGPGLDPRIKIFAYDNIAVNAFKTYDLSPPDWARLFRALAANQPRAIFVDKVFGMPVNEAPAQEFRRLMTEVKVPVVVGAFFSEELIKTKEQFDLNREEYLLGNYVASDLKANDDTLAGLEFLPIQKGFIYGPDASLADSLRHVGQINYRGSLGYMDAFIRIAKNVAIPHAGLLALHKLEIHPEQVMLGDKPLPLSKDARILINLDNRELYESRTKTIRGVLNLVYRDKPINSVKPGDIVVILPAMYTGHMDILESPQGVIQGGYLFTAIINSALTGRWIKPLELNTWLIFAATLFGFLIGVFLGSVAFSVLLLLVSVAAFAAAMAGFAYQDLVTSWFIPQLAFLIAGIGNFLIRARFLEERSRIVEAALKGIVSPKRLAEIIANPASLKMDPSAKVVTIAFIDLVGFSLIAETQTAPQVFDSLRTILSRISDIVHRFGGVVDNVVGDGLLCFFGYNYDGSKSTLNHPDVALLCAMEIQRDLLRYQLELKRNTQSPLYPIRIGINTAGVTLGDLGGTRRFSPTIIGHGVNFAKRLEAACEPFKILIGQTTYDLLTLVGSGDFEITQRLVQVKHHRSNLMKAYEINPFATQGALPAKGLELYHQSFQFQKPA